MSTGDPPSIAMKHILVEHAASVVFVGAVFLALTEFFGTSGSTLPAVGQEVERYVHLSFVDFGNPLHRAAFRDALNFFTPASPAKNDSVLVAIDAYRAELFTRAQFKTGNVSVGLSMPKLIELVEMWVAFTFAYFLALALTSYGSTTLAVYLFVRQKQSTLPDGLHEMRGPFSIRKRRRARTARDILVRSARTTAKGLALCVLLAPSYVLAYSFRASFESASIFTMVIFAVLSNGLLLNHVRRVFTYIRHESRKGYVETALAKNLDHSYAWNAPDGISLRSVLSVRKRFPGHVFQTIYDNASMQSFPDLKELGSFLVTGLVIVEMALNIQGHLCYDLLQNILQRQFDVVLAIVFGIFLTIKITEAGVELMHTKRLSEFENRE